MGYTTVNNMCSWNAAFSCHHAAFDFWYHPSGNCTVVYIFLHIFKFYALNKGGRIVYVFKDSRHICKLNEFFGSQGNGNFCCGCVGVYVVAVEISLFSQSYCGNYRNESFI